MRLHAAIFSFSQNVPVLGIDYFADRNSKLTQLFRDERRDRNLCGMEAFTADWMQERLALALLQAGNRRAGGAGRSDDEAARLPAATVSDRKP
jgi:polysaccharide pyruvyl transferase WcaK-like protein